MIDTDKTIERAASVSDQGWLWETYKTLLKEPISRQWGWDEAFQKEGFYKNLPVSKFIIILHNNKPVGAYQVLDEVDHLYLKMLLITEEHQDQGLGTRVMQVLKESASGSGKQVRLSVINANPVLGFYTKLGFEVSRVEDDSTYLSWG